MRKQDEDSKREQPLSPCSPLEEAPRRVLPNKLYEDECEMTFADSHSEVRVLLLPTHVNVTDTGI